MEMNQLVLSKSDIELNRIQKITEYHEEIKNLIINSLEKAFAIGLLLLEQKKDMIHGEFIPWIEKNLSFGERTARNYMMVYKKREMLNRKAITDLNTAYIILKETKRNKNIEKRINFRKEIAYRGAHIFDGIPKEHLRVKVDYIKTNSGFTLKKTIEESSPGTTIFYASECVEPEGREIEKNKAPYEIESYFYNMIYHLEKVIKETKKFYKEYGDAIYGSYKFNWNDGKKYLYPELEKAYKKLKKIFDKIIESKATKKI